MSFSKEVKKEILDNKFNSKERALAFLCGLVYSSAEYEVKDGKIINFVIPTDVDFLVDSIKEVVQDIYGFGKVSMVPSFKISKTQYYNIEISDDVAEKILYDTFALTKDGDEIKVNEVVSDKILATEDGLKGFMSGAYIGCGTSSIKLCQQGRTTTGYHIELGNQNYELLHEISNVLAQFEILAKLTKRKNLYVLYVKDAEEVSNMLALMGASNAVLTLQNEIVTRQVRNKVNRQNNCFVSNFSKTLNASFNQLQAIKVIEQEVGLYSLPEDLQEAALLRLANTEESLEQLLKLSKKPLTKSALNHKFQKIIKMANKLKK
ncbi:MAG: DNA-binding protein WhiA [Clostridiales bacterium]|nr:DNA-binding protein WhiA [Clostridiales bacterium]